MYYGERFNSISHLTGAVLAAVGGILLVVLAASLGDPWKVVSFSVYGAALLGLYLASTLYHSLRGRAKRIWCKFDHCAIYLLIAGSYTPFALVSLRGAWGWTLFGIVWGLAVFGIVQEIWLAKGRRILSLLIYVAMGWLAVIAAAPLIHALGWDGFRWLFLGGLIYTVGIIFYATDEKWRYGHGVWHLFVMGGSACHYFTVVYYVA
ncbi:PAQR family membrane homeostasis protein TrhA [Pollutimonas harenae]|uniref:Hemolysin III family protein n=1 Tax=Pollutimonas harenae TaxID=657015 RepID=A0A853H3Z8_9BURK|nr:hemolysin III family protein [Pollutimonas harenae]NYT86750.1 hemolysin III family protein [Pollutimonas harenae]TEA71398.1 hemolysin III family protein [Pollutimonas harenae]